MEKTKTNPLLKQEAVRKVLLSKSKIADVAREFKVARKTIYSWIKRYKKDYSKGLRAFEPHYVKGEKHPNTKYTKIEKKVLALVSENPKTSIGNLAQKIQVSTWTTWKILERYNLNTLKSRIIFSENRKKTKMSPKTKREIVYKALYEKEKITHLSKEYKVTRKTIYSWISRLEELKSSSLSVFEPRYVKGTDHPKAKYPKVENQLLDIIVRNPHLSIGNLAKEVPVSVWTVWNVLDRYDLNTKENRFAYAKLEKINILGLLPHISFEKLLGFK